MARRPWCRMASHCFTTRKKQVQTWQDTSTTRLVQVCQAWWKFVLVIHWTESADVRCQAPALATPTEDLCTSVAWFHYALDAYCLVKVYEVLRRRAEQLGINPVPWMELRNWQHARRSARLKHEQFTVTDGDDILGTVIRPYQLSLVADVAVQDLGRHLRCCGVDIAIVPPRSEHEEVVRVAQNEKRIIITCGRPYMELRQGVPSGRVFAVPPGRTRDQVMEVLRHFNVCVLPEDIFSRCQACNSCEYRRIRGWDMHSIQEEVSANATTGNGERTPVSTASPSSGLLLENGGGENGHCNDNSAGAKSCNGGGSSNYAQAKQARNGHASPANGSTAQAPTPPQKVPFISLHRGVEVTDCGEAVLESEARLWLDAVSADVLESVESFVCCCGCGKVFWEGQNSVDIRKRFQPILDRFAPE